MIDNENIEGSGGGFKFEAELFLHGSKDGRARVVVLCCGRNIVRRPSEFEVVVASEASFIDNGSAGGLVQQIIQ